jgi:CBS domain containing-hemolysin-like protein
VVLTVLGWLAVVGLIAANGLFVSAEFALTSVDRGQVTRLARVGDQHAAQVQSAVRELSLQLSGAQLGITVCSLLLGFVAEPVIAALFEAPLERLELPGWGAAGVAVVLALLLATLAQMLFGELVPQNLAISRPLQTALVVTPYQQRFTRAVRPLIVLFNGTANAIVRRLGAEPQEELRVARTPAELASLFDTSAEEGTVPAEVARLLRRTLAFGDKTAGDVMTPRVRVVALHEAHKATDLLEAARRSGHSRFPVHRGQVDEMAGAVHVKSAFAIPRALRASVPIAELMVEPVRVPESLRCDAVLGELRDSGLQLAIVVDEYGSTAGVVTLEDLIEELVGDVLDEYDETEEPDVVPLPDGGWSVSGLVRRDELSDRVGFASPDGPYDTLAGLFLYRHGRVPRERETIAVSGWTFTVTRMEARRIDRIRVLPPVGGGS